MTQEQAVKLIEQNQEIISLLSTTPESEWPATVLMLGFFACMTTILWILVRK